MRADDFDREAQIYSSLLTLENTLDLDGDDDEMLFKRVLGRLGPVGPSSVYGFVPAAALGDPMLPDHIEILDAEVHLRILNQVTPRVLMVADPRR
ncbi:T6SS immunity protein Tdi1 domain-containing protein [Nocardia arthritidis]|uniref:DUF1851 domain-containing protein n=1 Tax=Nocardia arthritidis TaxID=228602 RepID=A0A6G9YTP9_9NOCA|nr:DUF1851 domain-containing protein [Nocardia arthritidis]